MTPEEKIDALTDQITALSLEVTRFTAAHPPTLELINANIGAVSTKVDGINTRLDTQNGRVGRLERWRTGVMAILLFLSAVGGYVLREGLTRANEVYTFMIEHKAQSQQSH